jgi:hypothetical protein
MSDGRRGHDAQSRGLALALQRLVPCTVHTLDAPGLLATLRDWLRGVFAAGRHLPAPQLILGAGHATHLPMLAARRARGGRVVVLMKPSLPLSWFDCCLIPEHDRPPARGNVIATRGMLNHVQPAATQDPAFGLILVGGPSKHYHWDAPALLAQIRALLDHSPGVTWTITDSPRTPPATRAALKEAAQPNAAFQPHAECDPGWLEQQYARAGTVWVSRDSLSMIYEALTAGAAVGILDAPRARPGRVSRAVDDLLRAGLVTDFSAWQRGVRPAPPAEEFNEARRCARLIKERGLLDGATA